MKSNLLLYFFIAICFSCKHLEYKAVSDNYIPAYSAEQIEKEIRKYYIAGSFDSLMHFLVTWNKHVQPATNEYINQNDTIQNIFLVFTDLYKPFAFGNYPAMNYFGGENKFIVIQNEINYAVVSSKEYKRIVYKSRNEYPHDTIYEFFRNTKKLYNFRPPLSPGYNNYLYLTDEYRQGITDFLGLGTFNGDIFLNDTLLNRYKFICPLLPVTYGHWGGYWHIETFPVIERIIFDDKFQNASVDFRYSLEETVLQYRISKKAGHWKAEDKWLKIRME